MVYVVMYHAMQTEVTELAEHLMAAELLPIQTDTSSPINTVLVCTDVPLDVVSRVLAWHGRKQRGRLEILSGIGI